MRARQQVRRERQPAQIGTAGVSDVCSCGEIFSHSRVTKDDQIFPIGASAILSAKLVKNATLKVYPGFSHGMCTVNKEQINADLHSFITA